MCCMKDVELFTPGRNLSVNKSLVFYKGRLAFRQYIKTKGARLGIKLYELCIRMELH